MFPSADFQKKTYKGSHQKKYGQSWDFVPTGGREASPDPNLLTGFLKCSECPETYKKHKKIFLIFLRGRSDT